MLVQNIREQYFFIQIAKITKWFIHEKKEDEPNGHILLVMIY